VNATNVRLESIRADFNCSTFDAAQMRGIISGNYTCDGTHQVIVDVLPVVVTSFSSSNVSNTIVSSTSIVSLPTASTSTTSPGTIPENTDDKSRKVKAVAIAVTISVVGSLALISSVIFLFWRKRRNLDVVPRPPPKDMSSSAVNVLYRRPETPCKELDAEEIRPELSDGIRVHEMEDGHGITEMGNYDSQERYELQGSPAEHLRGTQRGNWI
jgi:hypothetical protein